MQVSVERLQPLLPGVCAAVWGLGLSRVLFELFFPRAVWLGRPAAAVGLALLAAVFGWVVWRALERRFGDTTALALFLPLLLNAQAVMQPQGPTLHGRLLFAGSLWLALAVALLLLWVRREVFVSLLLLVGAMAPVYLLTMAQTVGRADTFEFQVVIPKLGIVHPTGYPLYLLLGKLFTFIPFGPMAWRINLASVLFATVAAGLVFLFVWQVTRRALPGLLAALLFGLGPTFWSQAIEAEVYALHAVVVGGVLVIVGRLEVGDWRLGSRGLLVLLFLLLGLGLTNHLTTIILLPAVVFASLFTISPRRRQSPNLQSLIRNLLLALLLPLLLYAYLPIRWAAVNGEAMGWGRFVDWVIGGRFQGALRLDAFVTDPSRYAVVGRLLLAEWQPAWLLLFSVVGFAWLMWRSWRLALVLGVTFVGYVFYALSFYVPDLAVFLLPAQLVLAILWGLGMAAVVGYIAGPRVSCPQEAGRIHAVRLALLAVPMMALVLNGAARTWGEVDRSEADGGTAWAAAVLELPLEQDAAILADSERFPPLYYLQQSEGARRDLDIMVLPDEAAYRAELSARLAAGQTVYLARFLPGLEGQYHLRSVGPLVEVGREPLTSLPPEVTDSELGFDGIRLLGFELDESAAANPGEAAGVVAGAVALTLYWQAQEPVQQALYVYTRWQGDGYQGEPIPASGQYPANDSYPTVAWEPGEVVPDYHLLPRPLLGRAQTLSLQVALAPPFSAPADLQWQTVTTVTVEPPRELAQAEALYAQVGAALLDGVQVEMQIRPQDGLPVLVSGCGEEDGLEVALREEDGGRRSEDEGPMIGEGSGITEAGCDEPFLLRETVDAERQSGGYQLWASSPGVARCHWLARPSSGCSLAAVEISGVALPAGATNFDDKIALLELDVSGAELQPGGTVTIDVTWQALAGMDENYTVFAQVVDAQDNIVGQIDTWPRQGTFPTGQWQPGEVVRDTYTVRLEGDVPPGDYRLLLGWYLLATQQRLPVLNESGTIVENRVVVGLGR